MTDAPAEPEGADPAELGEGTFTQADIDKITAKVRAEERRKATEKFADYDELKVKAGKSQTLEERLAALEGELSSTKASALRATIASEFGISTKRGENDEPSQADLFLTGTDEATLRNQAKALADLAASGAKKGNIAPREGTTTTKGNDQAEERQFARNLFGGAD